MLLGVCYMYVLDIKECVVLWVRYVYMYVQTNVLVHVLMRSARLSALLLPSPLPLAWLLLLLLLRDSTKAAWSDLSPWSCLLYFSDLRPGPAPALPHGQASALGWEVGGCFLLHWGES